MERTKRTEPQVFQQVALALAVERSCSHAPFLSTAKFYHDWQAPDVFA